MVAVPRKAVQTDPFAAEPCCFAGPEHGQPTCEHWRKFDELMLIARPRSNLTKLARQAAGELCAQGIQPYPQILHDTMLSRVANARPRSAIIPWHLPDAIVQQVAWLVANDVVGKVGE